MRSRMAYGLATLAALSAASVAMGVPFASGVEQNGTDLTFVLNEDANQVKLVLDGTTVDLGALARGSHTVPVGAATSWQIKASKSSAAGWSQMFPDSTNTSYYVPLGVAANKNPASANFGKVYIANSVAGTTLGVNGRATTDGIYMLKADGSQTGFTTGGKTWTGSSAPKNLVVGADDHLYVDDFSNDSVFEFSGDMSSVTQILGASNRTTNQYVEGIWVEGTQAQGNRVLYTVNSNFNDATARKGMVKYELGAASALADGDTGTMAVSNAVYPHVYFRDMVRDSQGNFYGCQYRFDPTAPAITKFDANGNMIWELPTAAPYSGAYGIDIDEAAGVVAYGDYYTGFVRMFDIATGAEVASFDAGSRLRELAFDAAGNLITVDNTVEQARFWSKGGDWMTILRSDGTFAVVPEPASLSLLVLGGLALLRRRR